MTEFENEPSLVRAWAQGDQRAFEVLFVHYRPVIKRLCTGWLNDEGDAEEAVQETFLKAYRAIGRIDTTCKLDAWLKRIARNVCIDQIRRRLRRPSVASRLELVVEPWQESEPEQLVAGGDLRLHIALDNLAPQHRTAVELRFIGGLSHREMAHVLSKSPSQVKALLHRARTRLLEEWRRAEVATAAA